MEQAEMNRRPPATRRMDFLPAARNNADGTRTATYLQ
jgi:hypothetical protein